MGMFSEGVTLLQDDKILHLSKMKALADNKIKVTLIVGYCCQTAKLFSLKESKICSLERVYIVYDADFAIYKLVFIRIFYLGVYNVDLRSDSL